MNTISFENLDSLNGKRYEDLSLFFFSFQPIKSQQFAFTIGSTKDKPFVEVIHLSVSLTKIKHTGNLKNTFFFRRTFPFASPVQDK